MIVEVWERGEKEESVGTFHCHGKHWARSKHRRWAGMTSLIWNPLNLKHEWEIPVETCRMQMGYGFKLRKLCLRYRLTVCQHIHKYRIHKNKWHRPWVFTHWEQDLGKNLEEYLPLSRMKESLKWRLEKTEASRDMGWLVECRVRKNREGTFQGRGVQSGVSPPGKKSVRKSWKMIPWYW